MISFDGYRILYIHSVEGRDAQACLSKETCDHKSNVPKSPNTLQDLNIVSIFWLIKNAVISWMMTLK